MKANLIVVGGPIAVGKSSLVKELPYSQIQEIDENDKLQMLFLKHTYDKKRVSPETIELFFLEKRKQKYIDYSGNLKTHVFDRSIFETLWFAKINMDDKSFKHFKKLWTSEILELIQNFGKPNIYIILTMGWETFKDRFFARGRKVEIQNFEKNETFFKKHISEYEIHMTKVLKFFSINFSILKTDNLSKEQVLKITKSLIHRSENE